MRIMKKKVKTFHSGKQRLVARKTTKTSLEDSAFENQGVFFTDLFCDFLNLSSLVRSIFFKETGRSTPSCIVFLDVQLRNVCPHFLSLCYL